MAVDPFKAEVFGYDAVSITWGEPTGTWAGFRLLRSRTGFPITENDGELVLEFPVGYSGATGKQYLDTNRQGGWHYYAIFLWNTDSQVWERAGALDVLVPFDFASTEKMWDTIPDFYKQVRDDGAGFNQQKYRINPAIYLNDEQTVPNLALATYLRVLGWGMDVLRSQAEQVRDGYDVDRVHVNRLALLAAQFGGDVEDAAPANVNRSMVRNLGYLYRKRGTLEGIREMIALATGWEVDVDLGPNLMLSEDQANFVHPSPQPWDHTVRYNTGDRVRYGKYLFEAKKTAYGKAQGPAATNISNEWWDNDRFVEPLKDTQVGRTDTGDISTWQIEGPNGFETGRTWIGAGTTDPEDGTIFYENALSFGNDTATASVNYTLRSVPRFKDNLTSWHKRLVIESGIPVPRATKKWDDAKRYRAGDMVLYKGALYEATGTTDAAPTDTTSWNRLGHDERPRLCLSWFAHGPFSGTVNTGGVRHHAVITQFDENGDMILDTICTPDAIANTYFDPFTTGTTLSNGRVPAKGAAWSANGVGTWGVSQDDNGGYAFPPNIAAKARNLHPNPGVEGTTLTMFAGANGSTLTRQTASVIGQGSNGLRVSCPANGVGDSGVNITAGLTVTAGRKYTLSVAVRAVDVAGDYRISVQGGGSGSTSGTLVQTLAVGGTGRLSATWTAAASGSISVYVLRPNSTANQVVNYDIDAIVLEDTTSVPATTTYYDGSTADNGAGTFYYWEGTANNSVSARVNRSYQLAPATLADGNVAVTFRAVPANERILGLVFRWVDSRNFWIATQTGVYKVVDGVRQNPASGALTYPSFGSGDRLRVSFSGSTIQVFKNGTSLGTATDSFNATANRHGVEVEA
jgi:phage tail-like protein